ncbi:MAG TPA: hypothetical protein VGN26_17455 [Armatimonadota bacterium]|jgi:hypothetical protein
MDTQPSRLLIRRLRAEYLVPADCPDPRRVRELGDAALTRGLGESLRVHLARGFPEADTGVWLIRRLEVNVDINAAWDREQVTRASSERIAEALGLALRDGDDGEDVLWFPSPAALLARFLVDTAAGTAGNRWYYARFVGLRMLPASSALRTALCDDPAQGQAALLGMAPDELRAVLRALTVQDSRRALQAVAGVGAAGSEMSCFRAAWSAWQTAGADLLLADDEWRASLRLYLGACLEANDVGGPPLLSAARALVRLHRSLHAASDDRRRDLLAALSAGSLAGLYDALGADSEPLAPLLRCPAGWVAEVAQGLVVGSGAGPAEGASEARYTPFGGLFLLLPLLAELPLEEDTQGWPAAGDVSADKVVRFLLLLKCLGHDRAPLLWADPVARDLLAIPPTLSIDGLSDWGKRVGPAHLRGFLRALNAWPGPGEAPEGATWVLARTRAGGEELALLLGGKRGEWRAITRCGGRAPEAVLGTLGAQLGGEGSIPSLLLADPALLSAAERHPGSQSVIGLGSEEARQAADEDPALAQVLARLSRLPEDLTSLALPRALGLRPALDRALSVPAQGVLRAFASRLPGFAHSGLPYLQGSFLDFRACLHEEESRRVVELSPPPLQLILNVAGLTRATYSLEWLDDRPLCLFPAE